MSTKTVFPGMENGGYAPSAPAGFAPAGNFNEGTRFPNCAVPNVQATEMQETHKPILGFLYSVSRIGNGEFWPLHLGANTIGRDADCDVVLNEGTVSGHHADLVIRQMKNPDKIIVSLQDSRSTCGTMLNGSSLGFDLQECHHGDIITIGEHYELYFILVDVVSLGIKPIEGFVKTAAPAPQSPFPGTAVQPNSPFFAGQPSNRTIVEGTSAPAISGGKTTFMPPR